MVRVDAQGRRRERTIRALNVIVALAGLIVTAPLMLLIAIAVKASSPGPILFTQPRIGLNRRRAPGPTQRVDRRRSTDRGGRIFTIYKFRTMSVQPREARQRWATQADPRVTSIGRFLRATRLDELPQFVNVLKGDMNIVGPRPEQPDIFAELEEELGRNYRRRQRVLPGITGLAQVRRGYDTDLEGVREKVNLDLEYITRRKASYDLEIMAKTVPVMLWGRVWRS